MNKELKRAWKDSNPGAPDVPRGQPGSLKKEQAGTIYWNKNTGELEVERSPDARHTRDRCYDPPDTSTADRERVADFHTHPNKASEGYSSDPSTPDKTISDTRQTNSIIETHDGRKTVTALGSPETTF